MVTRNNVKLELNEIKKKDLMCLGKMKEITCFSLS